MVATTEKCPVYDGLAAAGLSNEEIGKICSSISVTQHAALAQCCPAVRAELEFRKDAEGVPWMAKYTRNSWPKKVVWLQDDITHDRFYWLKLPDKAAAKAGQKIVATVEGQTVKLEGDVPAKLELRLSDALLDLDQPVTVIVNGKEVLSAKATRNAAARSSVGT